MADVPFHLDQLLGCSKQQHNEDNAQEIDPNINFEFEENSPFSGRCHVGDILKTRQIILSKSKELGDLTKKI